MLVGRRMSAQEAIGYWIVQFLGAIAAGALLKLFVSSFGVTDYTGGLGTNSYDNGSINLAGAFVLEAVLTAAFVLVILLVTERVAAPGFAGIAIGLTLTLVHLVGIPLTGTSVNPARSLGPALFEGGVAMQQVWLFILAPLVGALIAVVLWRITRSSDEMQEDLVAGSERE
jgi:aquaporin Z